MKRAAFLVAIALLGAGCDDEPSCPPVFKAGDRVKHKTMDRKYLVLQDNASARNMDGFCLVWVRRDDGGLVNLVVVELEKFDG